MLERIRGSRRLVGGIVACFVTLCAATLNPVSGAAELTPEQVEFFETKVRPVLAGNCYTCHSADTAAPFANLRLDSRAGVLKGGDSGPAVVPGDSGASRLVQTIRYASALKMPPTGKLSEEKIEALVKWVEMEAPWPNEATPGPAAATKKFDLEARRREHWVWRPIRNPDPPAVNEARHPVDRFLLAKLKKNRLSPAPPADRLTLLRRTYFDLTGLPPSPEDIRRSTEDTSPDAHESLVDRLLASPGYGEHWARHWLDWVRYSESHGSEGDPDVPQAWRYRDYVIRALNNDIPYDQLIREYLAGDLLDEPRINAEDGINESALGPAHFRMVEHGFQPVDPLEDRVNWTENQVDVFSKAFQGLTVACARCHDHKFDAISQKDFYAVFGTLRGARPIQATIDSPERIDENRAELTALKRKVKATLVETWLRQAGELEAQLLDGPAGAPFLERSACEQDSALYAWTALASKQGDEFAADWREIATGLREKIAERGRSNREQAVAGWDLRGDDYAGWLRHGVGLPETPSAPGEFWIHTEGERVLGGIYPSGVYSHGLSRKHPGILQSPRFKVESDKISLRLLGANFSAARLIVENYAVPRSGIYNQHFAPKNDRMAWATWDTKFWRGFEAYIEIATLDDRTIFRLDDADGKRRPLPKPRRDGRSFFGVAEVVFHDGEEPPKELSAPALHLLEGRAPADPAALAARYRELLTAAIEAWRDEALSENQALFLDDFIRRGYLETSMERLSGAKPLVTRYRRLEEDIPVPRRAPGILVEAMPHQPLLIRGSHKNPGTPVPPRYLEAFHGSPYDNPRTVRLRLADAVTDPANPLTARVIVNRLWYHLFGRGIVPTVDNFGKLGEKPAHPKLLDYLAARFLDEGASIKRTLRFLVTSEAYRRSSEPSPEAAEKDPANALLQHMPIRRLEAEAIRDAILAVSGQLDPTMYGDSIKTYYVQLATLDDPQSGQAKGDKDRGPLDGDRRRSVYLEARRNLMNPFLEVFDLPKPTGARGRRDITNVPAQSLTLMNSPFVILESEKWAEALAADGETDVSKRVTGMFVRALGRQPSSAELDKSRTFLAALADEHAVGSDVVLSSRPVWRDFAQAIFNFKEFLYIR